MYAVVHIADFALQALRRDPMEVRPVALIEAGPGARAKALLVALNSAARAARVELGMTAAQGQARCGELLILDRSPVAEQKAREQLIKLAADITPDFEDTSLGTVTLDLSSAGCGQGWELGWEIVEELAETSIRARVGIALTPDLALMVAKCADPVRSIIGGNGNDDFIRHLPIDSLEPSADTAMVLTLWGISTVGDFMALPQAEVADRLGPDALDLWERASGKTTRLLRLLRPPADYSQSTGFDYEIESLEPLLFTLRRLLETVCARLKSVWLAAGEIHLRLDFADGKNYKRRLRVPDPSSDVDLLFRMLRTHLEDFSAGAPVVGLRLEAKPARGARRQFRLFESGLRDPNKFAETLTILGAMLGADRVGTPEPMDTHRPDAFKVMPFTEEEESRRKGETGSAAAVRLGLPLRRFRPPLTVEVATVGTGSRPMHIKCSLFKKGEILATRGPWSASGDWWTGQDTRWSRLEWDIQAADGIYRLVCLGQKRWKLEGVYG